MRSKSMAKKNQTVLFEVKRAVKEYSFLAFIVGLIAVYSLAGYVEGV